MRALTKYKEIDQLSSKPGANKLFNRAAIMCSAGAVFVAVLGLLGWVPSLGFLGNITPHFIPMAPTTSICFILLGLIVLIQIRYRLQGWSRFSAVAVTVLLSVFGIIEFAEHFHTGIDLEDFLVPDVGLLGLMRKARMSPATGATVFLSGVTTLLLIFKETKNKQGKSICSCSGIVGSLVVITSLTFLMSYLYGSPLLYGSQTIPMAATTAIGFLFLGVGLVTAAGQDRLPIRLLTGNSTRAKLLRTFLPLSILIVMSQDILHHFVFVPFHINSALLSALLMILFMVITSVIVTGVSGAIGRAIDAAKTKYSQAEEEKKQLQDQLRQTQKLQAIGTLAGGIAHDFNNILMAIIGNVDLALDNIPDGSISRSNLQQALIAGSRAKKLVQQILTYSRKTEQERIPVEVAPVVKEALEMLRSSMQPTIEIRENIEADSSIIIADPTHIHQILVNLCTNASHAIGNKGGVLEVSLSDVEIESNIVTDFGTLQQGSYVKLTVQDAGCGMDREVMERIFEPFYTTKDVNEGTGMGLSVVHGIVESYGGLITVDSEPGGGTTFNVFFPRIKSAIAQPAEPSEIVYGRREMILLVDDEKPIVDMMTQTLQRLGYTVVAKNKGIDALEAFQAEPDKFDLVITDYAMPGMTGKELAKQLMGIRDDIPLILCTGFSDDIDAEEARSMGIKAFVAKPISRSDISLIIRNILDRKEISV